MLPAAAAETFAALLAKANLDCIYDSPAIGVHHALLRTVYGFSHGRVFQDVIDAAAREEFYALCDAASAAIDQETDAAGGFARTKESFLRQLGSKAGDPAFTAFLSQIETLLASPVARV